MNRIWVNTKNFFNNENVKTGIICGGIGIFAIAIVLIHTNLQVRVWKNNEQFVMDQFRTTFPNFTDEQIKLIRSTR